MVVQNAQTFHGLRFAIEVFLTANNLHVRGGLNAQLRGYEILNRDGGAIVPGQTVLDLYGVGLGTILVVLSGVLLNDGGVDDVFAALIGHYGAVVVDHIADQLVGGIVGPQSAAPVAGDLGRGTIDQGIGVGRFFSVSNAAHQKSHDQREDHEARELLHSCFLLINFFQHCPLRINRATLKYGTIIIDFAAYCKRKSPKMQKRNLIPQFRLFLYP